MIRKRIMSDGVRVRTFTVVYYAPGCFQMVAINDSHFKPIEAARDCYLPGISRTMGRPKKIEAKDYKPYSITVRKKNGGTYTIKAKQS